METIFLCEQTAYICPMKNKLPFLLIVIAIAASCGKDKTPTETPPVVVPPVTKSTLENTVGFGVLDKVKGIWDGPVTSTTGLGSFPVWIVDFRPISENQVSAKNELDPLNDIHLSFFVALYDSVYKVAFRNGGSFAGMHRTAYFLADSVSETSSQSYYRFAEIKKGRSRAYTEITFKGDSLIMKSYTNKSNSQSAATLHMTWKATRKDATTCQAAVSHFAFPKKSLTKDFTTTFNSSSESIFYDLTSDPYLESSQPYLGQTTINYSFTPNITPSASKKVILMITSQPLINGFVPNYANLKFRSRYVVLAANNTSFTFNYMHPGTYYVYGIYDADGNLTYSSGDAVSTTNSTFTLTDKGTASASVQINYSIP